MQTDLSQFTAVIGIDWADKKHDICIQDMATGRRRASQVRHRAEDLDEWARSLHRRFGGRIAIAVELSKGPIINALQKYDFFVIKKRCVHLRSLEDQVLLTRRLCRPHKPVVPLFQLLPVCGLASFGNQSPILAFEVTLEFEYQFFPADFD